MTFILKTDIHFVHIWGIEFLLNIEHASDLKILSI